MSELKLTPERWWKIVDITKDHVWDETPCTLQEFLDALKDDMLLAFEERIDEINGMDGADEVAEADYIRKANQNNCIMCVHLRRSQSSSYCGKYAATYTTDRSRIARIEKRPLWCPGKDLIKGGY